MRTQRQALSLVVGLVLMLGISSCSKQAPEHLVVSPEDGEVHIPVSQVSDGNAHFYTFKQGHKNINFFARIDASGQLLTHFDACYSCFKYKEGYVQKNREVVCLACRIGFDLDVEVWDWVGPCVPVTLNSQLAGGDLVISVSRLEKGARLF